MTYKNRRNGISHLKGVSDDYSSINIWMGDASFERSGLPDTVEEYLNFLVKEHIFLDKRNQRIQEYCISHELL